MGAEGSASLALALSLSRTIYIFLILACSHGSVRQDCAAHGEIKVDDGVARLAAAVFFVV